MSRPLASEEELEEALAQALGEDHPVDFRCEEHNRARWATEKARLRESLLLQVIAARREGFDHSAHERLLSTWQGLEPEADWLTCLRPDPLDPIRRAFELPGLQDQPASEDPELLELLAGRPWKQPEQSKVEVKGKTKTGPGSGKVQDAEERASSDAGKQRRGALAEQACARQQAASLRARLQDPALQARIDAEREAVGDRRAFDWDELLGSDQALAGMLQLSSPGGVDCGYDVLSLDDQDQIVRIEVKSATSTGRVFLTRNELARCEQAPERYRLFLYVGLDRAHDLSSTLRELVQREELTRARETLDEALPASGYELHFSIQPAEDAP